MGLDMSFSLSQPMEVPNMRNFSMPEYIPPTLELDELMRLKRGLEMTVSKEASDSITSELPLTLNSTPAERAEWVEKVMKMVPAGI
ncbi:hypothetical protein [Extibacter muris]|uniref:hypothetical protein n=2 Tax=Extibacter muris TaxID=1796622 RepID=UPI001FAA3064|nr:hypothetical protein [Extibacter muris]